jgi:hypothetical protein
MRRAPIRNDQRHLDLITPVSFFILHFNVTLFCCLVREDYNGILMTIWEVQLPHGFKRSFWLFQILNFEYNSKFWEL